MLYTGQGDAGCTNVIGGPALLKCDVRLEAIGALDEAQAQLGLARALLAATPWNQFLKRVQTDLRLLMADCATVTHGNVISQYITEEHVMLLEDDLSSWERVVGDFQGFVVPGETVAGAHLHLARTVIRRAERQVVALIRDGGIVNPTVSAYLNRLSSWVYTLALLVDTAIELPSGNLAA